MLKKLTAKKKNEVQLNSIRTNNDNECCLLDTNKHNRILQKIFIP